MNDWTIFIGVMAAWIIPQLSKKLFDRSLTWPNYLYKTGGMPSSHTSTVTALSLLLLFDSGVSALFVLSLVLMGIVIRDAFGVRYAEGKNAHILKKLVEHTKFKGKVVIQDGHTVKQVVWGFVFGVVIAVLALLVL